MSARSEAAELWKVPVTVTDVPETGRRVTLVADSQTRSAIARAAGIATLSRFEASFDLTRYGRDGIHVLGAVSAAVGQNCVVTLDPMETAVEETVDLSFAPPRKPLPKALAGEDRPTKDAAMEDLPDVLHGGTVDLGAIAVEFLLLGIDPYPRKPGVVFEPPPAGDPASHPFAALAALKKGPKPKSG